MSRLFRVTLLVLTVLGLIVLVPNVLGYFLVSGPAAGMGLVYGLIYLVVVIVVLRFMPMWPRSGAGPLWIIASLLWGAGASLLLVLLSSTALIDLAFLVGWEASAFSWAGAYPEEIAKALGVVIILMSFRGLNRPWHGLMTGALVGLGFEVSENLGYGVVMGMMDLESDVVGASEIWLARTLAGPFIHVVWTALAGWGLGLALFCAKRSMWWRIGAALGWLTIAFALHFAWNYQFEDTTWAVVNIVVVMLIMYPLVIVVFLRARKMAKADQSYSFARAPLTSVRQISAADPPVGPSVVHGVDPGR